MVAADDEARPFVEDALAQLAGVEHRGWDEGDVHLARGEAVAGREEVGADHSELGAREALRERGRDARRFARLVVVGRRNRERPRALFGDERSPAIERPLEVPDRLRDNRRELLGARGGDEPSSAADDEGIAQDGAQACEGVAHSRLGHVEAPRGAGRAPLLEHGVKHDEEVQIDADTFMQMIDSITTHEWSKRILGVTLLAMNGHRRALVIGGGIAGPTLALFLARAGIEPHVFEAYPRTDDVGGGFQIAPNGLRVLAELGLADALLEAGHPSGDMAFRNHQGRDIGLVRTGDAGPAVNITRTLVHRVLREEADRRGISVRYGRRLKDIDLAGREVVASFEDGSTEVGDFVVGADGVRSRVRAWMHPDVAAPRDTHIISIGGFCARGMTRPRPTHETAGASRSWSDPDTSSGTRR